MQIRTSTIEQSLLALRPILLRRLRWIGLLEVTALLATWCIASFLLDGLFELPIVARAVVLFAAIGASVFIAMRAWRRTGRAVGVVDLAAAVEGATPSLEGHLLNALELPLEAQSLLEASGGPPRAGAKRRAAGLEEKLLERALDESLREARQVRIRSALAISPILRRGALAAAACFVVLLVVSNAPDFFRLWMRRNVLLSSEPWPRRTLFVLEQAGPVRHVARKDPLEIGGWVGGQVPRQVTLRLRSGGSEREATLVPGALGKIPRDPNAASESASGGPQEPLLEEGQRLIYTLPAVSEDVEYSFAGGDNATSWIQVQAHDRPRIVTTRLVVTPPAYLDEPAKTVENPGSEVVMAAGSTLEVEAIADVPLASGWMQFARGEKQPLAGEGTTVRGAFEPVENGYLDIGVVDAAWSLESAPPVRLSLVVLPDRAPTVALEIQGESRNVTARGRIGYRVTAEDDHAFSALVLRYTVRPPGESRPDEDLERTDVKLEGVVEKIENGVRSRAEAEMNLAQLQLVPGTELVLVAAATDNDTRSGPKTALSNPERFRVVDPDELRKELDRVRLEAQGLLEGLARREDELSQRIVEAARREAETGDRAREPEDRPAPKETSAAPASSSSASSSASKTASRASASRSSRSSTQEKGSPASEEPASEESPSEDSQAAEASPEREPGATKSSKSTAGSRKTNSKSSSRQASSQTDSKAASPTDGAPQAETEPDASAESEPDASPQPSESQGARPKAGAKNRPASGSRRAASKNPRASSEASSPTGEEKNEPAAEAEENANSVEQLTDEQQKIAGEARDVSRKIGDMLRSMRQNGLLPPAEDKRFRDEVEKPLEEVTQDQLPESVEDLRDLAKSQAAKEKAEEARRASEHISDQMQKVASKLAGAGDFREILQRLELIIDLQQKTIEETQKQVAPPAGGKSPEATGKERSL